jgi:hypothetical protein
VKFNNDQINGWVNHRVYPTFGMMITHFVVGAIIPIAYAMNDSDRAGLALFVLSLGVSLFTIFNVVALFVDFKALASDMDDDFRSTRFGGEFEKAGQPIQVILFAAFMAVVPVSHWILIYG